MNETNNEFRVNRSSSFVHRHYLLLKAHYFLSYASLSSFGPILNITLRDRGLSSLEISYINLVIPFLIFFTNPILGYLADHSRRFRSTFNITFGLGTILIIIMFYLPSIKTYHIQGELYQTKTMKYSMIFCANENFVTRCALQSECGCIYQAKCTPLRTTHNLKDRSKEKIFHLNFTMNFEDVEEEFENVSISNKKHSKCQTNYRVLINETIYPFIEDQNTGN